jgi:hypothetical protein
LEIGLTAPVVPHDPDGQAQRQQVDQRGNYKEFSRIAKIIEEGSHEHDPDVLAHPVSEGVKYRLTGSDELFGHLIRYIGNAGQGKESDFGMQDLDPDEHDRIGSMGNDQPAEYADAD